MAKESMKARERKREAMVAKYAQKRKELILGFSLIFNCWNSNIFY